MRQVCGLVVVMSAIAGAAHAGPPNHVRVLWDVERKISCAIVRPLSDPSPFNLPAEWPCTGTPVVVRSPELCTYQWCAAVPGLLRKGDFVTVYAYNYNAVSYKALASVATTVQPEEPVAVTLLAGLLPALGFKVTPSSAVSIDDRPPAVPRDPVSHPCLRPIRTDQCLEEISKTVKAVDDTVAKWSTELRKPAAEIAKARPDIPAKLRSSTVGPPDFGIANLKDVACRFSVGDGKNPLGDQCAPGATGWIQEIGDALGKAAGLVRAFDAAYDPALVRTEQVTHRDRYKRAIDGAIEHLTANLTGVRSELGAGVVQLADDLAAIRSYRNALNPQKAGSYAVELPRQGPVGRLTTLVFALPLRFVGDPEGAPAQTTRTFSIEVAPDRPVIVPSAGVMWLPAGPFGFKKLSIEQIRAGETTTLTRRLISVDTDEFRDVTALFSTNFRISMNPRWPYAALGTTADKNVFKNVLLGGAWHFPRLRGVVTVGVLGAKGSKEDEVQRVIDQYSVDGVVSDSINLTQVLLPSKWRWTGVAGWSFAPF